ncbi:MAG TPA: hypothetical protein PKE69_00260 [Pyrinomonadaceae bacterium]|nr:hypothetical protein [Pyrinomonadaceae bacterium]
MKLKQTRLHILHKAENLSHHAKTGVSLHCHTQFSQEMLDFIPHYAESIPIVRYFWKREREKFNKREGKDWDFSSAYWSPPLTPTDVFNIEKKQINDAGLDEIISITDHDSIDGYKQVHKEHDKKKAPISLEWTVPFEFGFFHVGIHNLPEDRAIDLTKTLLDYTFGENPTNEKLHELFAMLNEIPQVLVILNHPLWDIEMVGKTRHNILLRNFLSEHSHWLHALEINGFRTWSENKAVIEMAESFEIPICTGGDRHGCKPNTVINLTNAKTFEEFVDQVRTDKHTEVVLMPEYKQPLKSRQMASFGEIIKEYPHFPENRRRWFDRVFFDLGKGDGLKSLSGYGWKNGGPPWLRATTNIFGFAGSAAVRPLFEILRKRKDRVPKDVNKTDFEISNSEEFIGKLSSDAI